MQIVLHTSSARISWRVASSCGISSCGTGSRSALLLSDDDDVVRAFWNTATTITKKATDRRNMLIVVGLLYRSVSCCYRVLIYRQVRGTTLASSWLQLATDIRSHEATKSSSRISSYSTFYSMKWLRDRVRAGAVLRWARGSAPMKNVAPSGPPFWPSPASLDFHLNRPVISLVQLHIVPRPPAGIVPPLPPIWLVPEPPLSYG